jgi:hypothetical protein
MEEGGKRDGGNEPLPSCSPASYERPLEPKTASSADPISAIRRPPGTGIHEVEGPSALLPPSPAFSKSQLPRRSDFSRG